MRSLAARSLRGVAHGTSKVNGAHYVPALRSAASQARVEARSGGSSRASTRMARGAAVVVAAGASAAASAKSTDNPFDGAEDLQLLKTNGVVVKTGNVTQGRVVVGLLRHLG
ncbi:hypothetical protein CHLRE_16g691352v5 [Chlamydomonas reinhardtii]|uniref:Uncharacterized protein n=1 Tax=Chlamydomonas reinhardtii TaxID=3055 RepID=A0A2K3CSI4_CHLRE|nr:uncharacterized protein CHLRE_16g691352v5 [Chlamydomonas reinhardtii]PNW71257.1 hypothetical protein CHLRE_16g691352v5 [Chlamydomonas reinhardtii]